MAVTALFAGALTATAADTNGVPPSGRNIPQNVEDTAFQVELLLDGRPTKDAIVYARTITGQDVKGTFIGEGIYLVEGQFSPVTTVVVEHPKGINGYPVSLLGGKRIVIDLSNQFGNVFTHLDYEGDGGAAGLDPNDTCAGAIAVSPGGTVSGSTVGNTIDTAPFCGSSITAPGVWYSVVGNGNTLTATTCPTGGGNGAYDTKLSVYCGSCTALTCVGGNDDNCVGQGLSSTFAWCSQAGTTYWILVHGFGSATGAFTLAVNNGAMCSTPPPCGGGGGITCPPGGIQENEPNCGLPTDTVNGGCNSSPPVFTNIQCGNTICGSGAFNGTTRDTDWFKLQLGSPSNITWAGTADFDILIGVVNNFGVDSCAGVSAFLVFATGGANVPTQVATNLPAGTWYLFIAPQFTATETCPSNYVATLTGVCLPPQPMGACCLSDGSCQILTEAGCADAGGDFQGVDTDCPGGYVATNCNNPVENIVSPANLLATASG
jgi:hypothetical protein